MQRPSVLRSKSSGRFVQFQRKAARGLISRLAQLKDSWSNDSTTLEGRKEALVRKFEEQENRTLLSQATALHATYEQWDEEIDRWMMTAERETLLSLRSERESKRKLKTQLLELQASLRKKREDDVAELNKTIENKRAQITNLRDNLRKKADSERFSVQAAEQDLTHWFTATTGSEIVFPEGALGDEVQKSIQDVQEIPKLVKLIEEQKGVIQSKIQAIKDQVGSKHRRRLVLTSIGPVISLGVALMAWLASVPLIFVGILAVAGAVILGCAIYFILGLRIGSSSQEFVPHLRNEQNILEEQLTHLLRLTEQQYQREIKKLTSEQQAALQRLENHHDQTKAKALSDAEQNEANAIFMANKRRWELAQSRAKYIESSDRKWEPLVEQQKEQFAQENSKLLADKEGEKQNLINQFLKSQVRCADRWREGASSTEEWIQPAHQFLRITQPDWNSSQYTDGTWKRDRQNLIWRFGTSEVVAPLSEQAASCNPRLNVDSSPWPVAFDLMHHGALVLSGDPASDAISDEIITNLLLRSATTLPPGTMRFTIVDPQGLGKKYSWLMSLADIDPSLVADRVWTQPIHIADQLANIARSCEDIIQQSLRDNYRNLFEYNEQAGPMAVPYRLIVWDQFPSGLDEASWNSLCSILAAGGRCGVGVILRLSSSYVWPPFADPKTLQQFGLHLQLVGNQPGKAKWTVPELEHASIALDSPPTSERIREIMGHHHEHMAQLGRIVVPFDNIAVPSQEKHQSLSAGGLQIPVGVSSSGRTQHLKLGEGTAQHVLVAGKTGSGKSSLLHTLITSAALKYSSDQLRLVLLDFKKGVEFQVYAETKLPHADIIGIESKREFGVSTLEYIDKIMTARGELFRSLGVQDVPSLHKKSPETKMPRILIVIDEFQELFVEDDKISQQASLLMDRIVRQGRSFGVHLVLASQTLGGSYSLPRTTLAQMAVRIALQCDSSDAMLILGEDNTAAERLRFSGQAIYNESGGRIESNQGFQVAYADKDTLLTELSSIPWAAPPLDPAINPMGRQIVFEGHKPAIWEEPVMARIFGESTMETSIGTASHHNDAAVPVLLGDSVSIDPPVVTRLTRTAGRNLVLVGADDRLAASSLGCLAQSFLHPNRIGTMEDRSGENNLSDSSILDILDGTRPEDAHTKTVIGRLASHDLARTKSNREIEALFGEWAAELTKRLETPSPEYTTKLLCVVNLARFRELRKGDEFSFGDSDSSEQPDVVLANLLKDGPAVGLHVWLWADSANTLGRWLSRQSMRELELRVLMQMSSNDSNQLIDSNAANKLEANLLVFQDEMDGKPTKIRPFAWESLPLLSQS